MTARKTLFINKINFIFNNNSYIAIYQDCGINTSEYRRFQIEVNRHSLQILHLKNKLSKVALNNTSFANFSNLFEGPCLLIYGNSSTSSIKQLYSLHENFSKLLPIGGIFNKTYISSKQFAWLSNISHEKQFHDKIMHLLSTPSFELSQSIDAISNSFANLLVASRTK